MYRTACGALFYRFWCVEGQLVLGRHCSTQRNPLELLQSCKVKPIRLIIKKGIFSHIFILFIWQQHLMSRHENSLWPVKFSPSVSEILQLRHRSPFWRGKVIFSSAWWEFGILLPWTIWKISTWDSLRHKSNSTQIFPVMESPGDPSMSSSRWSRRIITITSQWHQHKT